MSDEQEQIRRRRRARLGKAARPTDPGKVPEARPPRPHHSAAGRVFYSLFVIFAVAGILAAILAAFGYQQYVAQGPLAQNKIVEVRKGLHTPEIAADLETAGVISDAKLFTGAALLTGSRGRLKAGEYEFTAGMSMRDVLGLVVQGKSIVYKLTIPEGWTTQQALDRIRANEVLTGELTLSPAEGAIFPDTYLFKRGATRDSVVQQMVDAQDKLIKELWEKRSGDLVVKSVTEAVTLASIVEKETALANERPRVAAVFTNRLKRGMRLQSDPTIIYGIVGGKGKLDRPLTKQDIAQMTPYNTYRINGLPPGPIANPGRAALEAVLDPPLSGDLYFVADGTGGHAFAATLDEHKKNVAEWREIERKRNDGEPDAVDELAAEKSEEAAIGEQAATAADESVASPIPQPQLPAGTAVTEPAQTQAAAGDQKVVTPELPAVDDLPVDAGANQPAQATDPKVANDGTAAGAGASAQQPAESPPADAKPGEATPEAVAAATEADVPIPKQKPKPPLQPGDVIKVANRLVPIPMPKPASR